MYDPPISVEEMEAEAISMIVQFNANLMEKNKKRKMRNHEVLLADDGSMAKEWVVDDADEEIEPVLTYGMVSEAAGVDEVLGNRTSARISTRASASRELFDEDFESEDEEGVEEVEVDAEDEYESDGVEIIEQYGQDDDDF
ncbi:hypothetical protein E3N88_38833 [Mikania micrantha]|uniref:Uncharacterized protein n=1 Tax=Mikania micrantha TaxID=192012 RepID=A0A5N6LV32_9ASTR|nr:hypothetical protein E3N88_38833 [Mikania micrantha]